MGVIAADLDNVPDTVEEVTLASGTMIVRVTQQVSQWNEVDAGDGEVIRVASRE